MHHATNYVEYPGDGYDERDRGGKVSGGYNNRGGNGGGRGQGLPGYIDVKERVDKFWREMRETKTPARIATEILDTNERSIIVKATVWMHFADVGWVAIADGLAEDMRASAPQGKCLEVAQTSAVGRALALAGYSSSEKIASREEMESYYAAVDAEARETAAHASPDAPQAPEAPQPTTATPIAPQTATKAKRATAQKVGIVSAAGEARGETVEAAAAAHARIAPVGAEQAKAEIFDDEADLLREQAAITMPPQPVAVEPTPIDSGLASQSPAFRQWIQSRHEEAEGGFTFESIREKFAKRKDQMTPAQYAIGTKELKRIKDRCAEVAAANAEAAALAPDVATELAQLSEQERAFLAS